MSASPQVPVEQIPVGTQFAFMRQVYRGKPRRTLYTVLSHYNRNGREFVAVRSDVQGDGSFRFGTLVEALPSSQHPTNQENR